MRPFPTVNSLGDGYQVIFPHAYINIFDEPTQTKYGNFWGAIWYTDNRESVYLIAPTQDKAIHLAFDIVERG